MPLNLCRVVLQALLCHRCQSEGLEGPRGIFRSYNASGSSLADVDLWDMRSKHDENSANNPCHMRAVMTSV